MTKLGVFLAVAAAVGQVATGAADKSKPVYENNFETAALNAVPEEMLVLDGAFAVKQENGNKFLELPGAPLDTFGVLFGPTEKEGWNVTARIFGTAKGRRLPAFGVGLNGAGGFRLQVSAAKNAVELFRGDLSKTNAPFAWQPGKWTEFQLSVTKAKDGTWEVAGKVWVAGTPEPARPQIIFRETEEPPPGRASIWGNPFSGTPIRFDDLAVTPAPVAR